MAVAGGLTITYWLYKTNTPSGSKLTDTAKYALAFKSKSMVVAVLSDVDVGLK